MSQNLSQNQLILDILKDTKEDLASIRQTNHDVLDQLNGVNGQLQLLRNDFENESQCSNVQSRFLKKQVGWF